MKVVDIVYFESFKLKSCCYIRKTYSLPFCKNRLLEFPVLLPFLEEEPAKLRQYGSISHSTKEWLVENIDIKFNTIT